MTRHSTQRISIVTLGCSKNTVDSEVLMRQIDANGLELVEDPNEAECVIINTCGFIDAAKEESVNTILEAAELKRSGSLKSLYVAGCLSERYREELSAEIPDVDGFFGVTDFSSILETLGAGLRKELLGERRLSTPSHTAYLKISEGCDRPCSFCSIPLMRGTHTSRHIGDIIQEANYLRSLGTKEIVLIAQDTTSYGLDLYGEHKLPTLLRELAAMDGTDWIRLMYAYPAHFPLETLDVIRDESNICAYIDLPIQHIDNAVLKSMRRGISRRATEALLESIRDRIPGVAIRSTLIVGYPNESEEAFQTLYDFVERIEFDRLGVFLYSSEENTPSRILGDPIPRAVKEERRDAIMNLQSEISLRKNLARISSNMRILLDRIEGDAVIGRTEFDAPEVDNEVLLPLTDFNGDVPIGNFLDVTITDAMEYDVFATIRRQS